MRKKVIITLITFLLSCFTLFLFGNTAYASSQKLNSIYYETSLNSDGTADIVETWDISVYDTNTLFKTFDLDSSKYGDITNVKVEEILEDGSISNFIKTNEYAYHVTKGYYYALEVKKNEFEIAWGVSVNKRTNKKYRITYKIEDAVKTYSDCSEFYWQFIGNKNGIEADVVEGIIKLPYEVTSKENLRVWAHGPLNGVIQILDNETVYFVVNNLPEETMVETRIAVAEDVFFLNENIENEDKLEKIIDEETRWAEEANLRRERNEKISAIIVTVLAIIMIITMIFLIIFHIVKIVKYIKKLKQIKKLEPEEKFDYFRDFPDERATPAEAAFLYYFDNESAFSKNKSKIVSATILNLALKKCIGFEKKDKEVEIIVSKDADMSKLKFDEASIFEVLTKTLEYKNKKSKEENNQNISMKDIENYARHNDKMFLTKIDGIEKNVKAFEDLKGNIEEATLREAEKIKYSSISYFSEAMVIAFSTIIFYPIWYIILVILLLCITCIILSKKLYNKTRRLTQQGINEQEKWKALKRYMQEFSMLDEREVPELALWEKYLVFATAFGISDKVLEQLKIKYPQIMDEEYMVNSGYTYLYIMNRYNFDRAISSGMQKAYNAGITERNMRSSGSGRWRRLLWWRTVGGGRWPEEWAEDKIQRYKY